MECDQNGVLEVIRKFLVMAGKPDDDLSAGQGLWGSGLGLDSLEAAELSAMLEDEFGTDPFSASDDMPESVGDVLAFYAAAPLG